MRRASTRARIGRHVNRWGAVRARKVRLARRTRSRTWTLRLLVLLLVLAVVPVPWLHVTGENPMGWAWRLDGRLEVNGELIDPPGRWSWLTVGRPPLLIEAARDHVVGTNDPARDLRSGSLTSRPAHSEPVAAAVGLRHAGTELHLGVYVELRDPFIDDGELPASVVVVEVNDVPLRSRDDLRHALELPNRTVSFVSADGRRYETVGPGLPYRRLRIVDLAPDGVSAAIGGPFSRLAPVAWFRGLSLGSSHGMMVALLTYAEASGEDLARGRHIAGTGSIRGDGTVTRIGGLPSKAHAARRAGADVLLFPGEQAAELEGFAAGSMELVPVETLGEAIDYLAGVGSVEPLGS